MSKAKPSKVQELISKYKAPSSEFEIVIDETYSVKMKAITDYSDFLAIQERMKKWAQRMTNPEFAQKCPANLKKHLPLKSYEAAANIFLITECNLEGWTDSDVMELASETGWLFQFICQEFQMHQSKAMIEQKNKVAEDLEDYFQGQS